MKKLFFFIGAFVCFYQLTVFYLQKDYFDFSQINPNRKNVRMLVLHRGGVGEKEAVARMKIASQRLGWECYDVSSNPSFWKKHLLSRPLEKVIDAVKPDFTLNFQCKTKFAPGINFVSLASGVHLYFGKEGKLDLNELLAFDGFLPTFQNISLLKEKVEGLGKPFYGMIWLFTSPFQPYVEISPKTLFYSGSNWDKTRKGAIYHTLFSLLDTMPNMAFYGPKNAWKALKNNYRGQIPFDGKSLIDEMQRCGIVLILHSESHIDGNSPTGRIFEAAAASCVIISDRHPFVVDEFGDSVLYIDQNQTPTAMFYQIQNHLDWIRKNPELAKEKALRAHQIFEEKFTLEKQLIKLKSLYDQVSS